MTRKTKTVTIESGRDQGKSFLITEMPVLHADKWGQKALFAIARAGIDVSNLDLNGGMLEMAKMTFQSLGNIDPEVGGELLDELLTCVQIIPSGGGARSLIIDSDINDIKTLYVLRKEALMIHLDFLVAGSSHNLSN